jgi:hypothetical protein
MTESARDEALRLAERFGHKTFGISGPIKVKYEFTEEGLIGLIALARQRPGWVWVPKEPTSEMINAAFWEDGEQTARNVWREMLAAAPKPGDGE